MHKIIGYKIAKIQAVWKQWSKINTQKQRERQRTVLINMASIRNPSGKPRWFVLDHDFQIIFSISIISILSAIASSVLFVCTISCTWRLFCIAILSLRLLFKKHLLKVTLILLALLALIGRWRSEVEPYWWMKMWGGTWLVDKCVRWHLIGGWRYEVTYNWLMKMSGGTWLVDQDVR